jgi:hypothetical protein
VGRRSSLCIRSGHEVYFQMLDEELQPANLSPLRVINDVTRQYGPQ